jgi:hypothetical protein
MTGNQVAMMYHKTRGYAQNLDRIKVRELQNGIVEMELYHVLYKIEPTGNANWFAITDKNFPLGRDYLKKHEWTGY